MSVKSQMDRISSNVSDTYSALSDFGATMPTTKNSNNLPSTARSIKAVLYSEQTLTEEEKAQARKNMGVSSTKVVIKRWNLSDVGGA